ncbi:MAG: NYN domain-containing protein [Oscillospiraceae bacterium]|nr:NYN domain-containing protein [Oscillospiraceae bacterium]
MKRICIGILAHVDAGKTTLSEGLLYHTGKIKKLGRVDHRDTYLDTHAIERERGITIFSKQAVLTTNDLQLTLLDTPGHVDFSAETERTLSVLDYAILVISASDGVQAHTETLWRLLQRYGVPTFVFVTKMDLPDVDRAALMQELKKRLGTGCVDFGGENREEEIAVLDDALLERYLENGSIETRDIAHLVRQRMLYPCYFGSGLQLVGVEEFLQGIEEYTLAPEASEAFGAKVFKISRDPQGARLTYLKVTGGSLKVRAALQYRPAGEEEAVEEKVNQIRRYSGAKFDAVEEMFPGDICAVTGLTATYPGQALGAERSADLPALEPVMSYRLRLPEGSDIRVELPKLQQLQEEDPQLHIVWDERLREIQLRLMGEVQIEVLQRMIADRFDLDVTIDTGRVRYLETIKDTVEGVGHYEPLRHYAEVHLLLEPLPRGSGLVFATSCREDVLDLNWQRLILTHLEEKPHLGVLTGSPITDMKITVVAGRAHLKHTEGGDFRQSTYRAVRHGLMKAESVLLEPYYHFRLEVPMEEIGRAISDIRLRSGTFDAPEEEGGNMVLTGRAPVAALRDYAQDVAAYTRGRGRFHCTVEGYDLCHNPEEVIAEIAYDPERDTENTADSVFCAHGAGFVVKWNEVEEHMHLESCLKTEAEETEVETAPRVMHRNLSIDDKELEAIMLREFGPISRRQYSAAREYTASSTHTNYRKKTNYLIVDGYNLIFAWDELAELGREDIGAARHRLKEILSNYRGYTGCELILVFDGYLVKGNQGSTEEHHGIHVVYTKEGETGDLYIERLTNEIGKNDAVRVATSDAMIQMAALRDGVQRMSSRELIEEIKEVEKKIAADIDTINRK